MKKIIDYISLDNSGNHESLDERIREKIHEGWQLWGNMIVFDYNGTKAFIQQMVKYGGKIE